MVELNQHECDDDCENCNVEVCSLRSRIYIGAAYDDDSDIAEYDDTYTEHDDTYEGETGDESPF